MCRTLLILLSTTTILLSPPRAEAEDIPVTGRAVPRLKKLDRLVLEFLAEHHLPGASLAIAKDGKLKYARGFGYADLQNKKPVLPRSRFNLASCSKPITGAAILKLVDAGKLKLDDKVFRILSNVKPIPGEKIDPRLREITVRQLLHHASGLERDHGSIRASARRLQVKPPLSLEQIISVEMSKPLLFDPGTSQKYSNLGFLALRLVVKNVAGKEFESYTKGNIFAPMGIDDASLDRMEGYLDGEVFRYPGGSLHAGGHGLINPDGGCWVMSPKDVVRFMSYLDGSRGERLLSPGAFRMMLAPLNPPGKKKVNDAHNGLGWDHVERTADGVLFSKNGGVSGISTWMEHLPNGVSWALFFNGSLKDEVKRKGPPAPKPWPIIREAIEEVKIWPDFDLFDDIKATGKKNP